MCGIAGFALTAKGRRGFPVNAFAAHLFMGIEGRGKEATGYVTTRPGKGANPDVFECVKEAVTAADFIKTHTLDARAQIALLHTRASTKGSPTENANNHPVSWGTCYAIHNGTIKNDDELLVEAGIGKDKRVGEVDSFAIPVVLDAYGWLDDKDIKASLHQLKGQFAIAACDPASRPGEVLLARGETSPLFALMHPNGVFWASSRKAVEDAWGAVVGTPPKETIINPNQFGWFTFMEGDWLRVDVSDGKMHIKNGRFEVNKAYSYANSSGNYGGGGWAPYTDDDRDWTCWPNEKNCVFGRDCGSCHNAQCECYDGNPNHPALNEELKFDTLCSKHGSFRNHVSKHKIKKELVERPIVGVQVVKPSPRPSKEMERRSPSVSDIAAKSLASRNISPPASNANATISTRCFYCETVFPVKDMKKLSFAIAGLDPFYACLPCDSSAGSASNPMGHDKALRPLIALVTKQSIEAEEVITAAVQETAWEFKIPPRFIKFVCMYNPKGWLGKENEDFAKFVNEVKLSFRENAKVVMELRGLEKAND